jgi:deoxyadenosine/deoxycytidine kinase
MQALRCGAKAKGLDDAVPTAVATAPIVSIRQSARVRGASAQQCARDQNVRVNIWGQIGVGKSLLLRDASAQHGLLVFEETVTQPLLSAYINQQDPQPDVTTPTDNLACTLQLTMMQSAWARSHLARNVLCFLAAGTTPTSDHTTPDPPNDAVLFSRTLLARIALCFLVAGAMTAFAIPDPPGGTILFSWTYFAHSILCFLAVGSMVLIALTLFLFSCTEQRLHHGASRLVSRYRDRQRCVLVERPATENVIFALANFLTGNLSHDEFRFYLTCIMPYVVREEVEAAGPGAVRNVLLWASDTDVHARMLNRGRPGEENYDSDCYLRCLSHCYFMEALFDSTLVVVDWSNFGTYDDVVACLHILDEIPELRQFVECRNAAATQWTHLRTDAGIAPDAVAFEYDDTGGTGRTLHFSLDIYLSAPTQKRQRARHLFFEYRAISIRTPRTDHRTIVVYASDRARARVLDHASFL